MILKQKKILFLSSLLSFVPIFSFAEYNKDGLPDSSEIRQSLEETWFKAPLKNVRMNKAELHTNKIGQKFQVRLEETEKDFNIFVSPFTRMEIDVYTEEGKSTEVQDVYPGDAKGSWVLIRDKKNGSPLRIRYYFADNSEIFVQFYPENKMAYGDFVIYNCYAKKGVPTGLLFDRFYSASFEQIKSWTRDKFPWEYNEIFPEDYFDVISMVNAIKKKLPTLLFTQDACYNENAEEIYLSTGKKRPVTDEEKEKTTLNGAGFLKWIVDGINEPLTGGYLKYEPLIQETVEYNPTGFYGIKSQDYSLSFTLDWTRNLATAISSVRTAQFFTYKDSNVDVQIEPFCAELTENGIKNTFGFIKDSGYSVTALKSLLYVLSVTEPHTFYLAAIRETSRYSPEVRAFNECAAIFPYFDKNKKINIAIFKDCQELDFESFYNRFCIDYVNLVKIQATDKFAPR